MQRSIAAWKKQEGQAVTIKMAETDKHRTLTAHLVQSLTRCNAMTCNIASWKKKEGQAVAAGDEMAEIETDKATMAWEAQDEGFIAKILAKDGAKDIAVGDPVMIFVEEEVRTPSMLCTSADHMSRGDRTWSGLPC